MNPLQSSETMSTGKIHCAKGKGEKQKADITLFGEVFLFCLVTVHSRTVFWAAWAARSGCGRARGHLPRQGRRDNHGTWPTPAPGAPAQPGSQRTSGEACLRDSRRHSLGAGTSKRVMKTQGTTLISPRPHLSSNQLKQMNNRWTWSTLTRQKGKSLVCICMNWVFMIKLSRYQTPAFFVLWQDSQVQH